MSLHADNHKPQRLVQTSCQSRSQVGESSDFIDCRLSPSKYNSEPLDRSLSNSLVEEEFPAVFSVNIEDSLAQNKREFSSLNDIHPYVPLKNRLMVERARGVSRSSSLPHESRWSSLGGSPTMPRDVKLSHSRTVGNCTGRKRVARGKASPPGRKKRDMAPRQRMGHESVYSAPPRPYRKTSDEHLVPLEVLESEEMISKTPKTKATVAFKDVDLDPFSPLARKDIPIGRPPARLGMVTSTKRHSLPSPILQSFQELWLENTDTEELEVDLVANLSFPLNALEDLAPPSSSGKLEYNRSPEIRLVSP